MDRLFKVLYFAGMGIQVILRAPHARRRRRIPKSDQRINGVERALLAWLSIGGLILPLVYSLTSWLRFADYNLSPAAKVRAGSAGTLLLAAGVWLFGRAHHDLGSNWSPSLEINAQQTLVTRGIYGTIRHPMYTSQLLLALAQALLMQNWIAGTGGIAAFLPMYLVRVPREERMMLDHFGDEYRDYCVRTGRIVPGIPGL